MFTLCACVSVFRCGVCLHVIPSIWWDVGWNELAHTHTHTHIIIELTFIYIAAFILGSLILLQQKKKNIWMSCERMPQWASNSLFHRKQKAARMHTHRGRKNVCFRVDESLSVSNFLFHFNEWICRHLYACVCVRATLKRIDMSTSTKMVRTIIG